MQIVEQSAGENYRVFERETCEILSSRIVQSQSWLWGKKSRSGGGSSQRTVTRGWLVSARMLIVQGYAWENRNVSAHAARKSTPVREKSRFWLISPDVHVYVRGEKKSLSVAVVDEFYTFDLREPVTKLILTLSFKVGNHFFALYFTRHEGKRIHRTNSSVAKWQRSFLTSCAAHVENFSFQNCNISSALSIFQ